MGVNFKLKGARVEKGFTQAQLAESIGISLYTYLIRENGEQSFTELQIKKICEALEKNVTDIFFN